MEPSGPPIEPAGHTPDGGVVVGSEGAPHRLVLFEDPQCPYCRQFEEAAGAFLQREVAAATVSIEYRMRCFLGIESVRADNALALAAEVGRFDDLRSQMFAEQPDEHTGGFSVADLIDLGGRIDLTAPDFERGIRDERFHPWVIEMDKVFQVQDPDGTPAAILDGRRLPPGVLLNLHALRTVLEIS
jgi:hypothetical protein